MALPTLTKTWQFSCNNQILAQGSALADNRACLRAIKNQMLAFGTLPWTVAYSCDSTTAGTAGDAVDRWSADSKLVWAGGVSVHSWIVLKQTGIGSNYQVLIDCNSANSGIVGMYQSGSAGFTGGTTTARPTATDEQAILAVASWTAIASDVAVRWNVQQSTDGQCTRWFVFSAGNLQSFVAFEKGANPTGGTPGASNTGWGVGGITGSLAAGVTRQNGTNCATSVSYESVSNLGIASEVSGVFDIFPIAVASTATVGTRGRLFSLQDIWIGSTGVATGDTYPSSGMTGQFIQVAQAILPWNNSAVSMT